MCVFSSDDGLTSSAAISTFHNIFTYHIEIEPENFPLDAQRHRLQTTVSSIFCRVSASNE